MKKITVQDKLILFLFIIIFVILLSIIIMGYPSGNSFMAGNWYIKGIIFGIYAIFLLFYCLREQIKYITLSENKIIIKHRKLLKSQIYEINKNDIVNCTMYVYRGNIKLKFLLNNETTLIINHSIVTPLLIEQISKISNFTDKFEYTICNADFPNNADIFEKIINNDTRTIRQQHIISIILLSAFSFIALVIIISTISGQF